jgi:membrane protein implicated in regulation of membrane protease activity
MEPYLIWMIAGFVLAIIELQTNTFYLLMLAAAAFGSALVAWLGFGFAAQAMVFAVVAIAGCWGARTWRAKNERTQMKSIDDGQPVSFENWVDATAGLARVRYRGASWDAQLPTEEELSSLAPGAVLYICGHAGSTFIVSSKRPL